MKKNSIKKTIVVSIDLEWEAEKHNKKIARDLRLWVKDVCRDLEYIPFYIKRKGETIECSTKKSKIKISE